MKNYETFLAIREKISEQEAMKLYRYIISVLEKPGRK